MRTTFIYILVVGFLFTTLFCAEYNLRQQITSVKVAGIVLKWIPREKEENYKHAEALIREAAGRGLKPK